MGSFNTTCFVTQQTIASGDRVVLIPIQQESSYEKIDIVCGDKKYKQQSYTSSTCYSTRFWSYTGPFVTGEYDDYGQFTLDNTESNVNRIIQIYDVILEKSLKSEQGKNECHVAFDFRSKYDSKKEYSFDQLMEIWEYMWEAVVQENRVFNRTYKQEIFAPFGFCVMHESAAKYLIASSENTVGWRNESNKRVDRLKNSFSKLAADDIMPTDEDEIGGYSYRVFSVLSLDREHFETEGGHFKRYYEIDTDIVQKHIRDNFIATGQLINDDLIEKILPYYNDLYDMYYISNGLNNLNISITPIVYAGQDYQNEIGNEYAKMIAEVNKIVTKQRKDMYGDDDYDEDEECEDD